jgi:hypothetical protein
MQPYSMIAKQYLGSKVTASVDRSRRVVSVNSELMAHDPLPPRTLRQGRGKVIGSELGRKTLEAMAYQRLTPIGN